MPDTADGTELLDVDVDQLAGPRTLVADRLLEPKPSKAAQPLPGQDPRDRRERHPQRLSDLGRRETQTAQLHDRLEREHGVPRREGRGTPSPSLISSEVRHEACGFFAAKLWPPAFAPGDSWVPASLTRKLRLARRVFTALSAIARSTSCVSVYMGSTLLVRSRA